MYFNLSMMNQLVTGGASPGVSISNFILARNSITDINQSLDYSISTELSTVSGPAPLSVNIDAIKNSVFGPVASPLDQLSFWIDTGDSGATFEYINASHPFGNDAQIIKGAISGHVYETPGTYTIKVYVYNHATSQAGYEEVQVTVVDADTFFPGTQTIVYSSAGDFTGAPAGADQYTSFDLAMDAWDVTGDRRLLLRAGEDNTINVSRRLRRDGLHYFGSFGIGDIPKIRFDSLTMTYSLGFFQVDTKGYMFYNVAFQGNYNPVTGAGSSAKLYPIRFYPTSSVTGQLNAGIYHCEFRGFDRAFGTSGTSPDLVGGVVFQDNLVTDWQNFAVFTTDIGGIVIRGNDMQQNPNATPGSGSKVYGEYTHETASTTITHNIPLESNYDNLYVEERDATTKQTVRELVLGVDYTNNSLTEINVPATVGVGNEYHLYHRRWATHGSIRTGDVTTVTYQRNIMGGETGWGGNGEHVQPAIRHNSGGSYSGAMGIANENVLRGGFVIFHTGRETAGNAGQPSSTLVEDNYLICDHVTWEAIALYYGGSTARNNVIFQQGMVKDFELQSAVGYGYYTGQIEAEYSRPIKILNNTLIDLRSAANMALGVVAAKVGHVDGPNANPDVDVANNLVYAPHDPVNTHTNYLPLNLNNYGAPQVGSSALNSGAARQEVFDDFFGNLRGATPSAGAAQNAVASSTLAITQQPASQDVTEGQSATLTVTATGQGVIKYQYYWEDNIVFNATSSSFATPVFNDGEVRNYRVRVYDDNGYLDSSIATLTAVSAPLTLTTDGDEIYAEIGGQNGVAMSAGDKLIIEYRAGIQGTYSYLAHRGQAGVGGLLDLKAASGDRWFFESSQADITIDGSPVLDETGSSAYFDGTWKTMEVTSKGSGFTVGRFFAGNADQYFAGGVRNAKIDKSANGGGLTHWAVDTGVAGAVATETPVIDENGIGDITIYNATSGDWS